MAASALHVVWVTMRWPRVAETMDLSIVADRQTVEQFVPTWRELLRTRPDASYFGHPEWLLPCWDARAASGGRPFVVVGGDPAKPDCLWPLDAGLRIRAFRVVRPLSFGPPYYNDLLLGSEAGADLPARALRAAREFARADLALFDKVSPGSAVDQLLTGRRGTRETCAAPRAELGGFNSYEAFAQQRLRSGFRKDQRRRRRRFQELGRVESRILLGKAVSFELVDWVLRMKSAWVRQRPGKADAVSTAVFADFVQSVWAQSSRGGHLYLAVLRLDGRPVAAEFGFLYRGVMSSWMAAYEETLAQFAPGRLLIEDCIRWCIREGVAVYDFLPSEAAYKKDWSPKGGTVHNYMVPVSLAGLAYTSWQDSKMQSWLTRKVGLTGRRTKGTAGAVKGKV